MKINTLHVDDSLQTGDYSFEDLTIIYSHHNQAGKTTLLRCILYALGYSIPSPRGFRFESARFILNGTKDDGTAFTLIRSQGIHIELLIGNESKVFSLPAEQEDLHCIIFSITEKLVLANLLGTYYFDQEKGWTLLNRGVVIGQIRFNIEDFLCGLSGVGCLEDCQTLDVVSKEIRKYEQMLDVAKYQTELRESGEIFFGESPMDAVKSRLNELYNTQLALTRELKRLENVIKRNTSFINFISEMKLKVKWRDEEVPVTAETLVGFSMIEEFLEGKRNNVLHELDRVKNEISQEEVKLSTEENLYNIESEIEKFDKNLANIYVNRSSVEQILRQLKEKRKKMKQNIKKTIMEECDVLEQLNKIVENYLNEFKIDKKYRSDILTSDLKSLSGVIFHMMVFAFRLAYITIIRIKTGCVLPIIIDSPTGREVEKCHIDKMMEVLKRDFSQHQIIIASIVDPKFGKEKKIYMQGWVTDFRSSEA